MSKIRFVVGSDWTVMYVDGKKVQEGHSIDKYQVLEGLGIKYEETLDPVTTKHCYDGTDFCEDEDEFPEELPQDFPTEVSTKIEGPISGIKLEVSLPYLEDMWTRMTPEIRSVYRNDFMAWAVLVVGHLSSAANDGINSAGVKAVQQFIDGMEEEKANGESEGG